MFEEDERLNKVKIAKSKKMRKDANDMDKKSFLTFISKRPLLYIT